MTALADLLLPGVAKRPQGDKVRVGDLARILGASQADVIAALEALVAGGQLDAQTLRPPTRPTGPQLVERIVAEAKRRDLSERQASRQIFGHETALVIMRRGNGPVRQGSLDKVNAWLANPPSAEPVEPGRLPRRVTGAELCRILRDEGTRRGMSPTAVSLAVFGATGQMSTMQRADQRAVRDGTRLKAQAWLDNPNAPKVASRPPAAGAAEAGGVRTPPPASTAARLPTGKELAAQLDALIAKHGLAKSRVGLAIYGTKNGVEHLRRIRRPSADKVERVQALLANPPLDRLRYQRLPRKAVTRLARPDPTQRPDTPDLDAAERFRRSQALIGANVRRQQEQTAAKLLDAGVKPGQLTGFQAHQVREIQRRRDDEARAKDPVAQAQLTLQRKGKTVYRASVCGRSAKKFVVSGCNRDVPEQDLVALADGMLTVSQFNERAK